MKAAIYLRVSTEKQEERNQEPDCLRVALARGWDPVYFQERESAVKVRPEWERLKMAAHRGEVGAVVVWALDRAGRDRVRLAHDLAEFARKGVAFVSVKESWIDQPVGPLRDLLIQVMGWFAESERARLIERTKAGQNRARLQGKHIGRKWLPAEVVQKIRDQKTAGVSSFLAAKALGMPESTVRTYYRRLANTFNSGYPRAKKPGE
jgi:DNA invertase Pin-like site-specific DNA recombinase